MIGFLRRPFPPNPLSGSQVHEVQAVIRELWPDALVIASNRDDDGGGAIVQVTLPSARFGRFATWNVRWPDGRPMIFTGHYFDSGFDCDVDFRYRVKRGH